MGLRGSGKSTLGRAVAARAGLEFVDMDAVTTGLLGEDTLPELWAKLGEPAFRAAEAEALGEQLAVLSRAKRVLALGGGTPTAPGAERMLNDAVGERRIELVYLRGEPELLRGRLASTDTAERPTLTGAGTLAEIERVFAARDGLYRRLASLVIPLADRGVEELTEELCSLVR